MHTEEKEPAWGEGKFEMLAKAIAVLDKKMENQEKRLEALESGRSGASAERAANSYADEILPRHIQAAVPEKKEEMVFFCAGGGRKKSPGEFGGPKKGNT